MKNVRFLANGLYGTGLGRYMIGLAPQAVVAPIVAGAGFDATPSLVHAGTGTVGFELLPMPKTQLGLYYGGLYAQRNFFPDLTAGGAGPCPGSPCVGFGGDETRPADPNPPDTHDTLHSPPPSSHD